MFRPEKLHELSITQQILDIALKKAAEVNATTINQINLVIGDMSTVVDDCVQFYFEFLSRDSQAQGARLSFQRVPMKVRCRRCNLDFKPEGEIWKCPQCQEWDVEIIDGTQFYLESIEVE